MAAKEYDNTNRGAAFVNKTKASPTHNDYSGSLDVEGVEYWFNCWVKKNPKDGTNYLSYSIKKKQPRAGSTGPLTAQPAIDNARADRSAMVDNIPF